MGSVKVSRRKASTKRSTSVKSVKAGTLPVLKANMFGIDFRELEDCSLVSFEFIDVKILGEVSGEDYVEVEALDTGVVYPIAREEFGKVVVGDVGMIHEFKGSRYGYSYLPF